MQDEEFGMLTEAVFARQGMALSFSFRLMLTQTDATASLHSLVDDWRVQPALRRRPRSGAEHAQKAEPNCQFLLLHEAAFRSKLRIVESYR